jgi:hypothetical protein
MDEKERLRGESGGLALFSKPPPAHAFEQAALMAGEESGEYE